MLKQNAILILKIKEKISYGSKKKNYSTVRFAKIR